MKDNLHIESFLEMMSVERGSSKNTLEAYGRDLRDFAAITGNPEKTESSHIKKYLDKLTKEGVSAKSRARKLSALRQFFEFLFTEKIRSDNPTNNIDMPKIGKSLPKFLEQDEVIKLIEEAQKDPRNYLLLELLYAAGLRVSELISLKPNSIRKEGESYLVFVKGKGNKERVVPIGSHAVAAYYDYLQTKKATEWLFPSGKKHITRQRFGQILKELAISAGVDHNKVSPHVIRHSFASHMLEGGADLRLLQELLGHSQIATTQIYTHIQAKKLHDTVHKHHPLAKGGIKG